MKRLVTFATLFLFLLSLTSVSAIGQGREVREAVKTRIEEKRATIQQRVEELREHREDLKEQRLLQFREIQATRRAEIASKVAELKTLVVEKIKAVFARILERMASALDRLDKIVAKINSRIAKLKEKGVDTTAAEAAVAACSEEKIAASTAIDSAKAKIAAIDSTSTQVRNAVHTANTAMRSGKRALQNYHKCLVSVIRTLRASLPKEATGSAQ